MKLIKKPICKRWRLTFGLWEQLWIFQPVIPMPHTIIIRPSGFASGVLVSPQFGCFIPRARTGISVVMTVLTLRPRYDHLIFAFDAAAYLYTRLF